MSNTNTNGSAVAVTSDSAMLSFIERAAFDPNFDLPKFEALLMMQERIVDRQARREYFEAMNRTQSELGPVVRDKENTFLRTRYATHAAIDAVIRPIYVAHGFSVSFSSPPAQVPGNVCIAMTVAHCGGHSELFGPMEGPPDTAGAQGRTNKTPVQAVLSTNTSFRRGLLQNAFNIAFVDDETDDDGESARTTTSSRTGTAGKGTTTQTKRGPDPLDEENGTLWLKNLMAGLVQAQTVAGIDLMRNHWSVKTALEKAPTLIRSQIESAFEGAYARVRGANGAASTPATGGPSLPNDRAFEGVAGADVEGGETDEFTEYDAMLNEVEGFDLITLGTLPTNAEWRGRLRALLPDQIDSLNDAIARRTGTLRARQQG
jgi:hypothetical protein